MATERTLILVKPDGVQRRLIGKNRGIVGEARRMMHELEEGIGVLCRGEVTIRHQLAFGGIAQRRPATKSSWPDSSSPI